MDRSRANPRRLFAAAALTAALTAALVMVLGPGRLMFDAGPTLAPAVLAISPKAIERADADLRLPGRRLDRLVTDSEAVLAGAWLAGGTAVADGWRFDADVWAPTAVERVAFAASSAGLHYERIDDGVVIVGAVPAVSGLATDDQRREALAFVVELGGNVDGQLARVSPDRADAVLSLARDLGLTPTLGERRAVIRLDRLADRVVVAGWSFGCVDRVPLVGGRGCAGSAAPTSMPAVLAARDRSVLSASWRVGVTDSLVAGSPTLAAGDGGVSWSNGEAQAYRRAAVELGPAGIVISAAARAVPDVDELPFESGMVVSEETFGYGRIEVEVMLPAGSGLWPAIWLLDATACEGPGRCAGYGTGDYHEIDLIETVGDDTAVSTVHWFEIGSGGGGEIRSEGGRLVVPGLSDGTSHTVSLDRLPGLLVWSIDGVEVFRVAGPATAEVGPHRAAEMRLVMNLAVGGSFAGDRIVGRSGGWWGDARVPAGFPDQGWSTATMTVTDVGFTPLDEVVLRP